MKIENENAVKWHRIPKSNAKYCTVCECPADKLASPVQQHRLSTDADRDLLKRLAARPELRKQTQLIEKGKRKWVTRCGTTVLTPSFRVQDALRRSARAIAAGMKVVDAAHAAEISINSFDAYRQRYPEYYQKLLEDAREKYLAGEFAAPVLPENEEDPGLTPKAKMGIRSAAVALATGISHAEVEKQLQLNPGAIHQWQHDYPCYWKACLQLATRVSRQIIKALEDSKAVLPNPDVFFRQIAAGERWSRKDEKKMFEKMEAVNAELSPEMTLTQFYWSYVRPICLEPKSPKPQTFIEQETSLRHWQAITGDPPLKSIDAKTCAQFVCKLSHRISDKTREKISPNTVRKHCSSLQFFLDLAGPRDRHKRLATGLIQEVPYLERPRPRPKAPNDQFTIKEIEKWLAALESATEPKNISGITPRAWWTALILFLYNTGLRIDTAMNLEWRMIEGFKLKVPGQIYKGGYEKEFILSGHAIQALEPLRRKNEIVFPWPFTRTSLQRHRKMLLTIAGIPENRQFGFHGLRKSLASELAKINPAAAQAALGHTSMKTTVGHYINPGVLADALNGIPQPRLGKS